MNCAGECVAASVRRQGLWGLSGCNSLLELGRGRSPSQSNAFEVLQLDRRRLHLWRNGRSIEGLVTNGTTLSTIGHLYRAVFASEARQSRRKTARRGTLDSYATGDSHWLATKPAAPRNDEP